MKFLIQITLLLALFSISTQLSCLNKNGQAIDYFALLKYPGKVQTNNFYAYYTSDMTSNQLSLGQQAIDQQGELIGNQFAAINAISGAQIIAWNDEVPDANGGATLSDGAHSKGLIAWDKATNTGIYIVHSIPKYPGIQTNGQIMINLADSQNIYGQSFLCMSMDGESLDKLAQGLLITEPYVYFTDFTDSRFPNLLKMTANVHIDHTLSYIFNYQAGSTAFTGFFKNPANEIDIFEELMSKSLQTSLLTETWGRPYRASECSNTFQVQNIKTIKINGSDEWKSTNDHSKYCISPNTDDVCFGGMNHMTSQQKRGGSFQCLKSRGLKQALASIVGEVESCSGVQAKFLSQ